jgi:quercetin dioxygenase-like cupin family protein
VQRLGGPVEEIRPGDVVWFEPEEQHWHGASPTLLSGVFGQAYPQSQAMLPSASL